MLAPPFQNVRGLSNDEMGGNLDQEEINIPEKLFILRDFPVNGSL
jgi:hypothetical protein